MLKWLQPGFAWGFWAAGGIVLLYLLRRRHLPRGVPSTLLWQEVIHEQEASHPFQKLKRHILLPIQLLAFCMLILGLMRPALIREEPEEIPAAPAESREESYTWREADTAPVRIAVAGADSIFLETALKLRPSVTVLRTTQEEMAATEADLYIYVPKAADGVAEEQEEPIQAPLVFSRTPGSLLLSWKMPERVEGGTLSLYGRNPLTEQITFRDVALRAYVITEGGKAAATVNGNPVIAYTAGEVMLGFNPQDSNLPMKYDFPILIQNILTYLMPETAASLNREPAESQADGQTEAERSTAEEQQPRELGWIFALAFLGLLTLEYGVSRYVG